MVGFVFFAPSPRNVSLHAARELGGRVKGRAEKVALTVDADDAMLTNIVDVLHARHAAASRQGERRARHRDRASASACR